MYIYSKSAFTLIELIMVIVIAAIILIPLSIVTVESVRNTFLPEHYTVASSLLAAELERLTSLRFNNVTNENGQFTGNFSDYSYQISFYYVDGSDLETNAGTPTDYKRVQITIAHTGLPSINATTIMTNN